MQPSRTLCDDFFSSSLGERSDLSLRVFSIQPIGGVSSSQTERIGPTGSSFRFVIGIQPAKPIHKNVAYNRPSYSTGIEQSEIVDGIPRKLIGRPWPAHPLPGGCDLPRTGLQRPPGPDEPRPGKARPWRSPRVPRAHPARARASSVIMVSLHATGSESGSTCRSPPSIDAVRGDALGSEQRHADAKKPPKPAASSSSCQTAAEIRR